MEDLYSHGILGSMTMKKSDQQKYRIVMVVTEKEKDCLKQLAQEEQRSMSGFLRYLLRQEIYRVYEE